MNDPFGSDVPATAVDGVLARRVVAWLIDAVAVTVLSFGLYASLALLGVVTLGLGWGLLPLVPLVPALYAWIAVSSAAAATPGQFLMGLAVVHQAAMRRPTPAEALVWTVLYLLSMAVFAPVLLVALITDRHRALHDIGAGLIVVRREALTARAGLWNMAR